MESRIPLWRAALAWTDAVTRIPETHAPAALYDALRQQSPDKQVADITWVIAAINGWSRMAIAFRPPAGSYQPGAQTH